ncbi:MAG: hypothetical protein Q9191_003828 [Dirinaria sp. TL-2023a]
MRPPHPPTLLSLLTIILSSTHITHAIPFHQDQFAEDNSTLVERTCAYPCGYIGICCGGPGECYTDTNNQAQCGSSSSGSGNSQVAAGAASKGQWQLYTTTYVETDLVTRTSTYSSLLQAATGQTTLNCQTDIGETPCGTFCCASGQFCQYQGQCVASGGNGVSSSYLASVQATAAGSPYFRPTTASTATVTSTGSVTTTVPYGTPSPTASSGGSAAGAQSTTSNNGLSGGQIAGIVIGVLLGILLLLIICGCLCFKGALDTILAFFGLGPRRRRREEIIEERYSHHHSGTAGGGGGRRWFGQGPARPQREKQSGAFSGWATVAGGLTALALLLGLKRRRDRRDKQSEVSYSSYTYSDYTSPSECFPFGKDTKRRSANSCLGSASSDRRTRNTRRSGR